MVGFAHPFKLLRQFVGEEFLVGTHLGVGVEIAVLALAYAQKGVFPIEGVGGAVGGIHHTHYVSLFGFGVEDEGTFVKFVGVYAFVRFQMVFGVGARVIVGGAPLLFSVNHFQEGLLVL